MLVYRIENRTEEKGLWYDYNGVKSDRIHHILGKKGSGNLPMPYDEEMLGHLSAIHTIEQLFTWFPDEDLNKLLDNGFQVSVYKAHDFKWIDNYIIINKESSEYIGELKIT